MKNLMIWIVMFYVGSTYVTENASSEANNIDTRLSYLIGEWHSEGFVTDAKGYQQFIDMRQRITDENGSLKVSSIGKNPANGYSYRALKNIYFDTNTKTWRVKGSVNGQYTLDHKVYITDNNTITFSFYDDKRNLMRYTFLKESDNSFTETEEIWTVNGWDKTAWFRTQRQRIAYK